MKKIIHTDLAPAAIGPYSQANATEQLLFVSGQLPIDPATGVMKEGIVEQTQQSLSNLKSIVEAAGATLANVVKVTVFLKDMNEFVQMNEIYMTYFTENYPARSAVEVARLPKDSQIEIEAIVAL